MKLILFLFLLSKSRCIVTTDVKIISIIKSVSETKTGVSVYENQKCVYGINIYCSGVVKDHCECVSAAETMKYENRNSLKISSENLNSIKYLKFGLVLKVLVLNVLTILYNINSISKITHHLINYIFYKINEKIYVN